MLFDPRGHEPLTDHMWDDGAARTAIRQIAADAESGFDPQGWWSMHPLDDNEAAKHWETLGIYLGASGVVWALDRLEREGFVDLARDWKEVSRQAHERYLSDPELDQPMPSLWDGESGMLLVAFLLSASQAGADRLEACVAANIGNETNELVWEVGHDARRWRCWSEPARTGGGCWSKPPQTCG
jgi:hypothetical protein